MNRNNRTGVSLIILFAMAHCVDKNEETSEETLSLYRQKERERERVDTENGWLVGWLLVVMAVYNL